MTGRIFFAGDTHGKFGHVIQAVQEYQPAAVVFLGDLQPQRPLEQELRPILGLTEIWWIYGNHDTDHWRGGLPRKHRSSIFPADYLRLVGERADILVTHEAPSSHPHGFDAIP